VTKRLIDIDDDLLQAAQDATGEATMKGTVRVALELAVEQHRIRVAEIRKRWERAADLLVDLHDPEVMKGAWR